MSHWSFIDFLNASNSAFRNEDEIKQCDFVSCFHCMKTYHAYEITKYLDDTAHCYICDHDSIIGDRSGYPIHNMSFLKHMNWYGYCHIQRDDGIIVPIKKSDCNICNNPPKYKLKKINILSNVDPFIMEGYTTNDEYMFFTIKFNLLTITIDDEVIYSDIIKGYKDTDYDISLAEIVKLETQYFCEFP